jgi:hypothetical protein
MFRLLRTGHPNTVGQVPVYVVCSECDFLRVRSERADGTTLPDSCPRCGSEVVAHDRHARFQPTYVSRVANSLHRQTL